MFRPGRKNREGKRAGHKPGFFFVITDTFYGINLVASRSAVPEQVLCLFIICLDADLLHVGIHLYPPALQVGIKIGLLTGKLIVEETIDMFLLFILLLAQRTRRAASWGVQYLDTGNTSGKGHG